MGQTVAFSVDPEEDRDIVLWLRDQGNKSDAIRKAIRAFKSGGLTLGDVYQAVMDVKRLIASGVVVSGENVPQGDDQGDDPEIAQVESILGSLGT